MTKWVDFDRARAVSFDRILAFYQIDLKQRGSQRQGMCPLPNHGQSGKGSTFGVNVEKGVFNCFGCKAKGAALEFTALMEYLNPASKEDIRKVAELMIQRFVEIKEVPSVAQPVSRVNVPLDFELQGLDPAHPSLSARGLANSTIKKFGLGYCSRGFFNGRIAVPIWEGKCLLGYAGLIPKDSDVSPVIPRLVFPAKRQRKGEVLEFDPGRVIYNRDAIKEGVTDLIIADDVIWVWELFQHGKENVVSIWGNPTDLLLQGIIKLGSSQGRVWILSSGANEPDIIRNIIGRIAAVRFVRFVKVSGGRPVLEYGKPEIQEMLK